MGNVERDLIVRLDNIEKAITLLFYSRLFYREFVEIINANPELRKGNPFLTWIVDNYLYGASMSLRRLLDRRKDTNSLVRIIEILKRNKDLLSQERYIQRFVADSGFNEEDAKIFFRLIAGNGATYFNIGNIDAEIEEIEGSWSKLKSYIDQRIAHESRSPTIDLPTVGDLDICIDRLGVIAKSIIELLTCRSVISFTPVIQFPWKQVFIYPWISPTELINIE